MWGIEHEEGRFIQTLRYSCDLSGKIAWFHAPVQFNKSVLFLGILCFCLVGISMDPMQSLINETPKMYSDADTS